MSPTQQQKASAMQQLSFCTCAEIGRCSPTCRLNPSRLAVTTYSHPSTLQDAALWHSCGWLPIVCWQLLTCYHFVNRVSANSYHAFTTSLWNQCSAFSMSNCMWQNNVMSMILDERCHVICESWYWLEVLLMLVTQWLIAAIWRYHAGRTAGHSQDRPLYTLKSSGLLWDFTNWYSFS